MKNFLLGLVLFCAVGVTNADSGAYVNLNAGFPMFNSFAYGGMTENINLGYNFTRGFALEGGYSLFGSYQYATVVGTNIVDVAIKGTIPFSHVFTVYARAGVGTGMNNFVGVTNVEPCPLCDPINNGFFMVGLTGAGFSFNFGQHFELHFEDDLYMPMSSSYTGTINSSTVGVQYNF